MRKPSISDRPPIPYAIKRKLEKLNRLGRESDELSHEIDRWFSENGADEDFLTSDELANFTDRGDGDIDDLEERWRESDD